MNRNVMVVSARSYPVPAEVATAFDDLIAALQEIETQHTKQILKAGRNPENSKTIQIVHTALRKVGAA